MADIFKNFRENLLGGTGQTYDRTSYITPEDNDIYHVAINSIENTLQEKGEKVSKGYNGEEKAYSQPVLGYINMNPGYKSKPNYRGVYDLHRLLKEYSNNVILNAIINTRANQASLYTQPVRYSEKGLGFRVRLRDIGETPSTHDRKNMKEIENFIMHTGRSRDVNRDSFNTFLRKLIRDTYTYDQVNFEKVFDDNGKFIRFVMKDPTTIYFATDEDGNIPKEGSRYVQVLDNQVRATFDDKEMAFAIRNPRSDIYAAGYGYSEAEQVLKFFISQENTENFNDRFFSNGGTTRGVLQIKNSTNQSQQALDAFKREWKNSLSGMNGSWQIPVVNAEDVKFVNMTPTARDMEKHRKYFNEV